MRGGNKFAAAAGLGGFGATIASVTLPLAYPEAPIVIWQSLLWTGLGMIGASVCWMAWDQFISPIFHSPQRPRATWIKLREAPFILSENELYWSQTLFWQPGYLRNSLPGAEPIGISFVQSVSKQDAKTKCGALLAEARILTDEFKFEWEWGDDDNYFMVKREPWDMEHGGCPEWLEPETWADIVRQSQLTWELLGRGLSDLVSKGALQVWGRMGSSTAPFSRLPANAWVHFSIDDWKHGRAKGGGPDFLFDIHIEPAKRFSRPGEG